MIELQKKAGEGIIGKSDAIDILNRTIGFVRNYDNKASIILGIFGVIFTIALTSDGLKNLASIITAALTKITFLKIIYLLLLVGAMAIIVWGMYLLVKVLRAQVDFSKGDEFGLDMDSKIFFQHISQNTSYINYKNKLLNMTEKELINDITSQIYINACICKEKHRNYRSGLIWSLIGFSSFTVLWIIGALLL